MTLLPETDAHLRAHHRDFASFAAQMVDTHGRRFDRVFWGFVDAYAPVEIARVVDLGTGPGLLLADLAARYPTAEIVGVDGQPEMLARARQVEARVERVRVVAHDVSQGAVPSIDASSVDLVVVSHVLHELLRPTQLLDEVRRALRPGGVLVLTDWIRSPLASYFEGKRPETEDQFTHFSEHCRYTADDVAWLVAQSGLVVDEWLARKHGRFLTLAARKPTSGSGAP
jgi:SAM-dependent methyltransferase